MKLGYVGLNQYGDRYTMEKYPRKELMEQLGATHAENMYVDLKSGGHRQDGYVIKGEWIRVLEVHSWKI